MANIAEISYQLFEQEVLKANIPVLVDFFAPWCGPCRSLTPVIEEVALSYKDKVKFIKVNVDDNQKASKEYKISSIPALILFNNGEQIASSLGAMPKSKLIAFLKEHIPNLN